MTHRRGDAFVIPAEHIHRIVDLPKGEASTFIVPEGPVTHTWGFYRWEDRRGFKRDHDRLDWQPLTDVLER